MKTAARVKAGRRPGRRRALRRGSANPPLRRRRRAALVPGSPAAL